MSDLLRRLTFPRVADQPHPLADGSRLGRSVSQPRRKPDEQDHQIVREILEIHKRLPRTSSATGEWLWINEHRKKNYLDALERQDEDWLSDNFANLFRSDVTYGIISSSFGDLRGQDDFKRLENTILLDMDVWREFTEKSAEDVSYLNTAHVG